MLEPTIGMWVRNVKWEEIIGKVTKIEKERITIQIGLYDERDEIDLKDYEEVDPMIYVIEKIRDIDGKIKELEEGKQEVKDEIEEVQRILRNHNFGNRYY